MTLSSSQSTRASQSCPTLPSYPIPALGNYTYCRSKTGFVARTNLNPDLAGYNIFAPSPGFVRLTLPRKRPRHSPWSPPHLSFSLGQSRTSHGSRPSRLQPDKQTPKTTPRPRTHPARGIQKLLQNLNAMSNRSWIRMSYSALRPQGRRSSRARAAAGCLLRSRLYRRSKSRWSTGSA